MAIYETANKLANEIKNSKEYIQFKKYMREIKSDPESEKLLIEYKLNQAKIQNFIMNNSKDKKKSLSKFESLQRKVLNNKKINKYLNSEQQFTHMMNNINQILAQAVESDYK